MTAVLDFTSGIQELTLDTLKRTYKEETVLAEPIMGIHHFDLLDKISGIIQKHGMEYNIQSMFAAQNKMKGRDGVAVNPNLEIQHGKGAPEAHVLRRVYTTFEIANGSTDELTTGLVVAFHQEGIQIAIGPQVKMCTNQCILSSERMISTYGNNKIKDFSKIFDIVDDWMHNFNTHQINDIRIIEQMKEIPVSYLETMELIGRLNVMRIAHDTSNADIKKRADWFMPNYPLNQGQISQFTEGYLTECIKQNTTEMKLWDLYNIATNFYKVGNMDIPNIIPQNVTWAEYLTKVYTLN